MSNPETGPGSGAPTEPQRRAWWVTFMPRGRSQIVIGLLTLMFFGGAIGFAIGTRDARTDYPGADSADVGFLYDMVAHHEQAVLLSAIELARGEDPNALATATEILRSQSYEIGLMEMRLGTFGHDPKARPALAMEWMDDPTSHDSMPGMATAVELDAFRAADGSRADALFYALMIDHHKGGVAMASHAAGHADDDWVVGAAESMARIQSGEITEMAHLRDSAGLDPNPPGYTPDFTGTATDHGD